MYKGEEKISRIGLVLEGGGGKGAYQIGAWKAIRELGIEKYICMVSGTSVGALNAALFYKGNLGLAEELWNNISNDDILFEKQNDNYLNGDCFFSQKKLGNLIASAIKGRNHSEYCRKCFVTCKYRDVNKLNYFEWSRYYDVELKKKILLASSAIPVIFESVEIDGDYYIDGGANGDNIPVAPLLYQKLDGIIIIHLSKNSIGIDNDNIKIYEVFPSNDLGGMINGTLDFDNRTINKRILMGYEDTIKALRKLGDNLFRISIKNKEKADGSFSKHKETYTTKSIFDYCK